MEFLRRRVSGEHIGHIQVWCPEIKSSRVSTDWRSSRNIANIRQNQLRKRIQHNSNDALVFGWRCVPLGCQQLSQETQIWQCRTGELVEIARCHHTIHFIDFHFCRDKDNLWESLTEEAHKQGTLDKSITVKQIMDSWTLQTGYPIITVNRSYADGSAQITQKRYLSDTGRARVDPDQCWWVPLSYTTSEVLDFNSTQPKSWLRCKCSNTHVSIPETVTDLPDETKWVVFNIEMSGLYKVKYDTQNWNLLIAQLAGPDYNKISSINRAQLIDDALDLAW